MNGELPLTLAMRQTVTGSEQLTPESRERFEAMGGDKELLTDEQRDELEWESPKPQPGALSESKETLGEAASLRGVQLGYAPPMPKLDRQELVERLRVLLAVDVIEDVILDGESCW